MTALGVASDGYATALPYVQFFHMDKHLQVQKRLQLGKLLLLQMQLSNAILVHQMQQERQRTSESIFFSFSQKSNKLAKRKGSIKWINGFTSTDASHMVSVISQKQTVLHDCRVRMADGFSNWGYSTLDCSLNQMVVILHRLQSPETPSWRILETRRLVPNTDCFST